MYLYLVRHGEAKSRDADPARPLSEKGLIDVKKVAREASGRRVTVINIYHSGKMRAKQTAELFAEEVKPSQGVLEKDGLNPDDDPAIWEDRLSDTRTNVMLVGHLPHVERLASRLLPGERYSGGSFDPGKIVCLERDINGRWSLIWEISPSDIT